METEIVDLRKRLATGDRRHVSDELSQCSEDASYCEPGSAVSNKMRTLSVPLEPQPMRPPLTMQRDGSILSQDDTPWKLEDISLSRGRVARLFEQYATLLSTILE